MQKIQHPTACPAVGCFRCGLRIKPVKKILLLHTFFGQICQGVFLVKFIDFLFVWSIIDFV